MKKTKAIEMLSGMAVAFETREFCAREFTAEEVSSQLALPLSVVFKTLIVQGSGAVYAAAVVPADRELNCKKAAAALGVKSADLLPLKDLQRLTGYLKGGVSPLGLKRSMPVLIDKTAESCEKICVSAGLRGLQMLLAPRALAEAAQARFCDLT